MTLISRWKSVLSRARLKRLSTIIACTRYHESGQGRRGPLHKGSLLEKLCQIIRKATNLFCPPLYLGNSVSLCELFGRTFGALFGISVPLHFRPITRL